MFQITITAMPINKYRKTLIDCFREKNVIFGVINTNIAKAKNTSGWIKKTGLSNPAKVNRIALFNKSRLVFD